MGKRSLGGKVVVITGGGSGIGRALAEALARAGSTVVVADVRRDAAAEVARAIVADRGRADAHEVDVTDATSVARLVDATVDAHGRIDVMINNAGIAVAGEFRDVPPEQFRKVVEVDFFGVVNGSRAAYAEMLRQGHGHIVNVASMYGLLPGAGNAPYVAAKHAVVGFSETLRIEAADLGVHVTTVCPGFIDTPLLRDSAAVGATFADVMRLVPFRLVPVERAVALIVRGIERRDALVVFPGYVHALLAATRTIPSLAFRMQLDILRKFRAIRRA